MYKIQRSIMDELGGIHSRVAVIGAGLLGSRIAGRTYNDLDILKRMEAYMYTCIRIRTNHSYLLDWLASPLQSYLVGGDCPYHLVRQSLLLLSLSAPPIF